jgi:hypothetical protein
MVFRVRLEMYGTRRESDPEEDPTTISGATPPTARERIVDGVNLTLTHHNKPGRRRP